MDVRHKAFFLAVVIGLSFSEGARADPLSDQDFLQGKWEVHVLLPPLGSERLGTELPPESKPSGTIQILGNNVRFTQSDKKKQDAIPEVRFILEPLKNPKTIDLHIVAKTEKESWQGIYALKKDEATIAFWAKGALFGKGEWKPANERPRSFDLGKPSAGCWSLVLVLKRENAAQVAKQEKKRRPLSAGFDGFGAVAQSPDGSWFAASGRPGTIVRVWQTATGKEIAVLSGHDSEVIWAASSDDGKRLFTITSDEARVWDVAAGKQLHHVTAGPNYQQMTFSGDGNWFMPDPDQAPDGQFDGRFDARNVVTAIQLWDVRTGKKTRRFEIAQTTARLFADYASYFILGVPRTDEVVGIGLSYDGKWAVAGSWRGHVHMWDASTGKEIRTLGRSIDYSARPVGFSRDGKWLATCVFTGDKKIGPMAIRIWDAATGIEKLAIKGNVFDPSFSEDGKWLMTGCREFRTGPEETTVKIWEVETGKEIHAFGGHSIGVLHASLSKDKKRLVTYDLSDTARLWDVETGKVLRTLQFPKDRFQVHINADAKILVAWDHRRLTLWDLEKGTEIRSMVRKGGSEL